jgi:hypothetical protein
MALLRICERAGLSDGVLERRLRFPPCFAAFLLSVNFSVMETS